MKYNSIDLKDIHSYHQADEIQKDAMERVREAAIHFAETINFALPDCADKMDSLRKVREAQMTDNTGIMLKGKV